ncbi:MAG TPA: 3-oxoadipate enol-lactonase [Burkholderiales bacterium]
MAFVDLGGERFRYELDGPRDAPALVLSNSLGTDLSMWEPQLAAFTPRLRVLRYDQRGHGESAATPGPYRMEQLGRDVLRLLDALGIERASFCGISMGGATGMWLGVHAPERFDKLVLCNTGAHIGTAELWNARIAALRQGGTAGIAHGLMERWFTPAFRAREPQTVERMRRIVERTSTEGYIACCEAIRDHDERETVSRIRMPTLVIAGTRDVATPPADGRFLAERIPGARYLELDVAHLSNIEMPREFNDAVLRFLTAEG